ncbi:MAG: ABC transporter substrate-binding protein [Chloroflexota bacterium]|nr:ABC transporter substrate-binding protein [Chloroflexota bacterium]
MTPPAIDRALISVAAALLTLAGCVPAAVPNTPTQAPTVNLKVVILPFIAFAPFYIAQDEGFFGEEGLNVEFVNMTTQPDTIPALVSGQVDVTSGQVSSGMLNSIAKGARAAFVADKGYIDPAGCDNLALVARSTLLPQGGQPSADMLRGKRLNLVRGTWMEYYIEKLLGTIDLGVDELETVQIPSPAQPEAMANGQLDMAAQNEPWVTTLVQAGHRPILTPVHELMPNSESAVMLYGQKLLDGNAAVGNRFMVAYLKAVRQYNQGKTDRNVAIVSKYTQLDGRILRDMCWPALRGDGEMDTASVLDFQAWAVRKGLLDQALPAERFWDPSFTRHAIQQLGPAR